MESISLESQELASDEEPVLSDADSESLARLAVEDLLLHNLPGICFPLFEFAHYFITANALRLEFGKHRASQSPLASCFSTLISCLAGSLMSNILLGFPPSDVFRSDWKVASIVMVWVLDCIFKIVNQPVVFSLLWSVKEVERMRKIVTGVTMVQDKYPDSVFVSALAGVLRGNGTTIIRPVVRLMSGVVRLDNELTSPGLSTKMCLLAALAWIWSGDTSVYTAATTLFLLARLHNILRSGTQRLGLNSINNNQDLQSETEDLSDKKDS